jgi:hypothetical protein
MPYLPEITANKNNPQGLEALYQGARGKHEAGQFSADLSACYASEPENILLQAWHYRLQNTLEEAKRFRWRSSTVCSYGYYPTPG